MAIIAASTIAFTPFGGTWSKKEAMHRQLVTGIDVFCSAGGLIYGLQKASISMVPGIDLDLTYEFPFVENNRAQFIKADVRELTERDSSQFYPPDTIRFLAGCTPYQPVSPFCRGVNISENDEWELLDELSRLVTRVKSERMTEYE